MPNGVNKESLINFLPYAMFICLVPKALGALGPNRWHSWAIIKDSMAKSKSQSDLLFGAGVPVRRYFEPVVQLELQFATAQARRSRCVSMAMHLKIVISPFVPPNYQKSQSASQPASQQQKQQLYSHTKGF